MKNSICLFLSDFNDNCNFSTDYDISSKHTKIHPLGAK
jgi:hypothetical protein